MNELCGDKFIESNYSGINVCCRDPQTNDIIGTPYPKDGMESDNIELDLKHHIQGEHWGGTSRSFKKSPISRNSQSLL